MGVETIKLKPCPFCGGAAGIHEGPSEPWVFCEDCGVGFEGQLGLLPALWNRRTDRQERIDELEYELEVAVEQRDQAVQAAEVAREERDAWIGNWHFYRDQRDLWQRRALYARRKYHEQKRRRRELAEMLSERTMQHFARDYKRAEHIKVLKESVQLAITGYENLMEFDIVPRRYFDGCNEVVTKLRAALNGADPAGEGDEA